MLTIMGSNLFNNFYGNQYHPESYTAHATNKTYADTDAGAQLEVSYVVRMAFVPIHKKEYYVGY